jgi:anti-sigma regulatory factor (Ser/Thr protein kinase)
MSRVDARVKFLVPSDARFLAVIRATVGELGSVCGFTGEDRRAITLAVDEAMANVIRHAYRGDPGGAIEMECQARADGLEFTLLDHGEPPDPARLKAHAPDEDTPGGRGTHLIRMIMDEVSYERVQRGNQLRLSKRLPGKAS